MKIVAYAENKRGYGNPHHSLRRDGQVAFA